MHACTIYAMNAYHSASQACCDLSGAGAGAGTMPMATSLFACLSEEDDRKPEPEDEARSDCLQWSQFKATDGVR